MKRLAILIVAVMWSGVAYAQTSFDRYFFFGSDIVKPMNNTTFINTFSVKGFQVGYRERINDQFYVGVDFNSSTLSQHDPRQTYHTSTGDLTAEFFKYVVTYNATLAGEYYFSPEKRLNPFAGLGIGANYNSYSMFYNVFTPKDNSWGVVFRPQAGVLYKLGREQSWGVIAAVHYDYSTARSDYFGYSGFTTLGFRIGVVVTRLFDKE